MGNEIMPRPPLPAAAAAGPGARERTVRSRSAAGSRRGADTACGVTFLACGSTISTSERRQESRSGRVAAAAAASLLIVGYATSGAFRLALARLCAPPYDAIGALRPRRRPSQSGCRTRLAPRRVLAQGRRNGIAANRSASDPDRDGHREKQRGWVFDPQRSVRHNSHRHRKNSSSLKSSPAKSPAVGKACAGARARGGGGDGCACVVPTNSGRRLLSDCWTVPGPGASKRTVPAMLTAPQRYSAWKEIVPGTRVTDYDPCKHALVSMYSGRRESSGGKRSPVMILQPRDNAHTCETVPRQSDVSIRNPRRGDRIPPGRRAAPSRQPHHHVVSFGGRGRAPRISRSQWITHDKHLGRNILPGLLRSPGSSAIRQSLEQGLTFNLEAMRQHPAYAFEDAGTVARLPRDRYSPYPPSDDMGGRVNRRGNPHRRRYRIQPPTCGPSPSLPAAPEHLGAAPSASTNRAPAPRRR